MRSARWLEPLLRGEIRSCFAMSEPDVGSSAPTQLQTRIAADGDTLLINGRKWFITGAAHTNGTLVVLMGVEAAAPEDDPYRRRSIVLVPFDTSGLSIERNIPGMDHPALDTTR